MVLKNGMVSGCGARSIRAVSSALQGLHHLLMKRMIDSDDPGEDALCLELGEHCFD